MSDSAVQHTIKFVRPLLLIATTDTSSPSPGPFKDGEMIRIVTATLSNPYQSGEKSVGRCRWKMVHATTNEGVEFVLDDDEAGIHNARHCGSGDDPIVWGKNLPGYAMQ